MNLQGLLRKPPTPTVAKPAPKPTPKPKPKPTAAKPKPTAAKPKPKPTVKPKPKPKPTAKRTIPKVCHVVYAASVFSWMLQPDHSLTRSHTVSSRYTYAVWHNPLPFKFLCSHQACGGKCATKAKPTKAKPTPKAARKLPASCHGKCATKPKPTRKLPAACGSKCGKPKPAAAKG